MNTDDDSTDSVPAEDQHAPAPDEPRAGSAPMDWRGARGLAEMVVENVLQDWKAHGAEVIAAVRQDRPHEFLKFVTGLFPKEKDAKENQLDVLTDEQLSGQLASVLAQLGRAGIGTGEGS